MRQASFMNGENQREEAIDIGVHNNPYGDVRPPAAVLIAELHEAIKGTIGAEPRVKKRNGKIYLNCEPTDYMPPELFDPVDWPPIVNGVITVTGWTFTKMERELSIGHSSVSGYARGACRPADPGIRARIIAKAVECGVIKEAA